MARASIYTLLTLDEFAEIMGIDPWEFNQIGTGFPRKRSSQCAQVFYQYPWQKDMLGREEVAEAIADAESMMAHELGYWTGPKYTVDEVIPYPRPFDSLVYGYAGTPRGQWKSVETRWHRFTQAGVMNRTLIGSAVVVFTDEDGDGILETFTATAATALTEVNEIGAYFQAADRNNVPLDETWRIRPVQVEISGGNVIVTGKRWQLVLPDLTLIDNPQNLDVSDVANFAASIDIYRVFIDITHTEALPYQGVAIWEAFPGCASSDCGFSIKSLCLAGQDAAAGRVSPALGQSCEWPQNREPDRLQVNYLSGVPLVNGRTGRAIAQTIARLAAALLASEKCGCDRSERILAYWRDPIKVDQDPRNYSETAMNGNPFSATPTRGSIFAWKNMKRWRDMVAVSI